MAGVPKGREYCADYFHIEDSWGITDLFECFSRYTVEFGKEFCDYKFADDKVLLMQCYAIKNVARGIEFCNSNFDYKTEEANWILCYESIPVFTATFCQIKHRLNQMAMIDCMRNKAKLVLDQNYCDSLHPLLEGADGEETFNRRYACYKDIQLDGF
jgi:hypothetical protein